MSRVLALDVEVQLFRFGHLQSSDPLALLYQHEKQSLHEPGLASVRDAVYVDDGRPLQGTTSLGGVSP